MSAAMLILVGAAGMVFGIARMMAGSRRRPPTYRPAPARPPARPARRPVREDVPHLLYAYHWIVPPTGRFPECYYGISNDPPARDARHAIDPRDQDWYQRSTKAMIPIEWYPNRAAARAAEREIVRRQSQRGAVLANDHHNVRRPRRALHP